jgi:hypothetical protein
VDRGFPQNKERVVKAQKINLSFVFNQFKGEQTMFTVKPCVNFIYSIFSSKDSLSRLRGSLEGLGDGSASC